MDNKSCLILWIAVTFLNGAFSQTNEEEFDNPCTSGTTCGSCIRISPSCAWCGQEILPRSVARCDLHSVISQICDPSNITYPLQEKNVVRDDNYSSGGQGSPPIQIKPQALMYKVRPNEPINFKLNFEQQANYPVDLYFLLDLSYGMYRQEAAQRRLISLGEVMPHSMANITNNFRLGFGTFVDKTVMPYTAWTQQMLQDRCPLQGQKCRRPHDYKNHVSLGDDADSFGTKMREALEIVSQSLDDAEGGLDGLIQALACNTIGWRKVTRRIIVFSSNSIFHISGDGKLGGATKQSDLQCDLSSTGLYKGEKIYDYPSVSQVASKLKEENANLIFAVMSNVKPHYELLNSYFDGSVVGVLEDNSNNIVDLIKRKYYEIRSKIKFVPSNATDIKVEMKSKCKGSVLRSTTVCENLDIMDSVEFDVQLIVQPSFCKGKSGIVNRELSMDAVGLNENMLVSLDVMCDCACEGPDMEELDSPACFKGNGTLECGICNCNEGRFGRLCQCDESAISSEESLEKCRQNATDDSEELLTCSGNGECVCGECKCFHIPGDVNRFYDGPFCGCNNYNCPVSENRLLCGGKNQGQCKCGECSCLDGWEGDSCDCSTDKSSCMTSEGLECNTAGECVCGRCICNETLNMIGPTCEDCLNCPSKCNEYLDCAQCASQGTGKYNKEECKLNCKHVTVKNVLSTGPGIRDCEGIDTDGCTFYFNYQYTKDNDVLVEAQETKSCPEPAPVGAIIGGTVAAVVLIPLLIICLIIFIRNRRDAKEYADFMKERQKARWESAANPIYKDPRSTFQNPTYGGKK